MLSDGSHVSSLLVCDCEIHTTAALPIGSKINNNLEV